MRTLHVITGLSSGGAERALHNLLTGGLADRFDTAVVSLRDAGVYGASLKSFGVPIHELNILHGLPGPVAIASLRTIVRKYRPTVIQGWMYHGNLAALAAAVLAPGRPVVAWNIRQCLYDLSTDKPLTRQVIRLNRATSSQAASIVYNSRRSEAQHEGFGFSPVNACIIANGFDTEALTPARERRAASRRAINIEEDDAVIGHVARFHPVKDHVSFLRAALKVLEHRSTTRFLLIGRNVTYDNSTLKQVIPNCFAAQFVFLGERSDVHELMQAMDILCLSSAWGEAFPNVLGEAMASGVPCIATDVGDSADIVDGIGRIVPPSQPGALAEAMLELLAMAPAQRATIGRTSRERIEARYALPAVVSQYAELHHRLAEKTK